MCGAAVAQEAEQATHQPEGRQTDSRPPQAARQSTPGQDTEPQAAPQRKRWSVNVRQ